MCLDKDSSESAFCTHSSRDNELRIATRVFSKNRLTSQIVSRFSGLDSCIVHNEYQFVSNSSVLFSESSNKYGYAEDGVFRHPVIVSNCVVPFLLVGTRVESSLLDRLELIFLPELARVVLVYASTYAIRQSRTCGYDTLKLKRILTRLRTPSLTK